MEVERMKDINTTLEVVCGKWKAIILLELDNKTLRFSELKSRLPDVSHQTLIKQLKELEEEGLVERKSYPVVPPKVEYSLTSYGKSLEGLLLNMSEWGHRHRKNRKKEYDDRENMKLS
ncbi:helix-turn-helix domain-containing protein [Evansella sp. LMS18]|uniref:winged helix-turn-helix transcriptional regulator n=1 Tax=Evansella sp. LMS18 TaxID=2924033 RepID=UPI0026F1C59F|nr:helix-turn-helix domain-containing protein [Evansella sp. LMS18]